MTCSTCSHAQADHATGKCAHSTMRHDPAAGAVIDRCTCKRFARAEEPTPFFEVLDEIVELITSAEHKDDEAEEPEAEEEPKPSRARRK